MLTPGELLAWLPPRGMAGRIEAFEARVGGTYRMTLTHEAADPAGKSSGHTDIVQGRFVELVEFRKVVQAVEFPSEDPAFAGIMTITWSLAPVPIGTRVTIACENVPAGIGAQDHAAGMASSLENLAHLLDG